jgi:hypothetical protein
LLLPFDEGIEESSPNLVILFPEEVLLGSSEGHYKFLDLQGKFIDSF